MSQLRNHTYSSVEPRTRQMLDEPIMREILADVGAMRSASELEYWASWMLGQTWKQRTRLPEFQEVDWAVAMTAPVIGMITEIGGARARKALTAIAMLDRGALGRWAGAIALTLPGARTPAWIAEMTDCRFVAARSAQRPEDGEALLFDLHRNGVHVQTIAVYVDYQLNGIAKWFQLLQPLEVEDWGDLEIEPTDLAGAAQRVRAAIELTDRTARVSVGAEFADLRAYVLARAIDACG